MDLTRPNEFLTRHNGDFDVDGDCAGHVEGFAYSSVYDEDYDVFGAVLSDGDLTLTVGGASTGATFHGTIRDDGSVSGTWSNRYDGSDGSFRGSRTSSRSCAAVQSPSRHTSTIFFSPRINCSMSSTFRFADHR